MGYENAPATKLVATHCCVCGRALLDAVSVQRGIGSICAENGGLDIPSVLVETRSAANQIVHAIACEPTPAVAVPGCLKLRALGFGVLADVIMKRVCNQLTGIVVCIDHAQPDPDYAVVWPYRPEVTQDKRAYGGHWDPVRHVNVWSRARRGDLWAFLQKWFSGVEATGPNGRFVVGTTA